MHGDSTALGWDSYDPSRDGGREDESGHVVAGEAVEILYHPEPGSCGSKPLSAIREGKAAVADEVGLDADEGVRRRARVANDHGFGY